MSFPVYLTHLVVICSVGGTTFIAVKPLLPHGVSIALTFTVVFWVTFVVSYPLASFDRKWVGLLNKIIVSLRNEGYQSPRGTMPQKTIVGGEAGQPASSELAA
jgi:peptidoglycan/LPS O-acetylase OafA/YrhL